MWILTSLAFFYIIIQYHVTNTWPLPINTSNDVNQEDGDPSRKIWLKNIVGDVKTAENIQNMLGEKIAKEMAVKINRNLELHSCLLNSNVTKREDNEPTIYIITPTYRRPEQVAELTRMSQTLMHLQNIYWLLVEDAREKSDVVSRLLKKSGIRFVHLTGKLKLLHGTRVNYDLMRIGYY